jgi:sugar phosphate isomerase/epimerase
MASMSPQMMRRELRKWRLRTPVSYFRAIGDTFHKAGITIYAYNYSPDATFTDQEIDRGFEMAAAVGAEVMTASTTLDVAKRIVPFAERHRMVVALHGGSRIDDPNELATPWSFSAAVSMSKYFKTSFDIGHFTAANFDALAYVREHHRDIATLCLRDRRKNQGEALSWGSGDTPIRDVLRLLKREGWPIRAYVDYDYAGRTGPVDEVKKCLAYAAEALA